MEIRFFTGFFRFAKDFNQCSGRTLLHKSGLPIFRYKPELLINTVRFTIIFLGLLE